MRRRPLPALLALVAVAAVVLWLLARGEDEQPGRLAEKAGGVSAYDAGQQQEFEERAAAGLAHPLFEKSPGGALATARRVAALRPLVERAAGDAWDPDVLEGIVFLESAGRPDATASDDLEGAAGLTQILAQTGSGLLDMRVDVAASKRYTRRLARATSPRRRAALLAARRRVDERFDPAKALAATVRYLEFAKGELGRDDLAVVSYHMGVGNLQRALRAYGDEDVPYAQLYFDSSPAEHEAAWRVLSSLGDDSSTYLWRIRAAQGIMEQFRKDPAKLAERQRLHAAAPSAEQVLRPPGTPRFAEPADLRTEDLAVVEGRGLRLSRTLAAAPAGNRALRPAALAVLRDLAAGVAEVSGTGPLTVTAASRDVRSEDEDPRFDVEAPPSMHTTGYAFDLSRRYRSPAQARALQFWLDRLTALDVIAWVREPAHIHVTVGPRAEG
ncbi:MAG: transglycosylase SLT domain-containing protein [Solirubrobacterales bacterium]|nr:transglycosylase SLT domain-containing protein [Solirubrobacterales bacterium]